MRWTLSPSLLLLLLIPIAASAGDIYRWTDENGQVHFGDHPVAADAQKIEGASPGDAATVKRLQHQQELLNGYQQLREGNREQSAKTELAQQERDFNCAEARDKLTRIQEARYVYRMSDSGERQILNDAEREASQASAQAQVDRWCN